MRRREFIALLGGAAVLADCGAGAAASNAGDRISNIGSREPNDFLMAPFR